MRGLLIAMVMLFSSSCFAQDRYDSRIPTYQHYSGSYIPYSSTASWSVNPPVIYSASGTYLGELSQNRYAPNSISNPYGRYGSRYSPYSVNNPYSRYGRYSTQTLYVYPRW